MGRTMELFEGRNDRREIEELTSGPLVDCLRQQPVECCRTRAEIWKQRNNRWKGVEERGEEKREKERDK